MNMKEELTTAMHKEFTVSRRQDEKHRCFAAWSIYDGVLLRLKTREKTITYIADLYDVDEDILLSYENDYKRLKTSRLKK